MLLYGHCTPVVLDSIKKDFDDNEVGSINLLLVRSHDASSAGRIVSTKYAYSAPFLCSQF